jgi:hypothetical protein
MNPLALGVCLTLAAHPASEAVFVPVERFTLAWTHSIEKVRWEEDYAIASADGVGAAPLLVAVAARVRGSGAGMEPPAGARLRDGWYEYRPHQRLHAQLLLARSEFAADYEFCTASGCQSMSALLPSDASTTRLAPCRMR